MLYEPQRGRIPLVLISTAANSMCGSNEWQRTVDRARSISMTTAVLTWHQNKNGKCFLLHSPQVSNYNPLLLTLSLQLPTSDRRSLKTSAGN